MFAEYSIRDLIGKGLAQRIAEDFPKSLIEEDLELRFFSELIPLLRSGEKEWTIRFKPNTIRIPASLVLPVIETQRENTEYRKQVGSIVMEKVVVGHVKDWPSDHPSIYGSGWESKQDMVKGVSEIYQPIYGVRVGQNTIIQGYNHSDFSRRKAAHLASG